MRISHDVWNVFRICADADAIMVHTAGKKIAVDPRIFQCLIQTDGQHAFGPDDYCTYCGTDLENA